MRARQITIKLRGGGGSAGGKDADDSESTARDTGPDPVSDERLRRCRADLAACVRDGTMPPNSIAERHTSDLGHGHDGDKSEVPFGAVGGQHSHAVATQGRT